MSIANFNQQYGTEFQALANRYLQRFQGTECTKAQVTGRFGNSCNFVFDIQVPMHSQGNQLILVVPFDADLLIQNDIETITEIVVFELMVLNMDADQAHLNIDGFSEKYMKKD